MISNAHGLDNTNSFLLKSLGYSTKKLIKSYSHLNQKQAASTILNSSKGFQPIEFPWLDKTSYILTHSKCFNRRPNCKKQEVLENIFKYKNSLKKVPGFNWKRQKDFYNIKSLPQLKSFLENPTRGFQAKFRRNQETLFKTEILKYFLNSKNTFRLKLALFFQNHFVSTLNIVRSPQYILQQFNLINQQLMGNFKDFVSEITLDPAMLLYLNGNRNFCKRDESGECIAPNENYARELLELFTLGASKENGIGNCYSEQDIKSASLALTGHLISPKTGKVQYRKIKSDFNLKTKKFPRKSIFQEPCHVKGFSRKIPFNKSSITNTDSLIEVLFERRGQQIAYFITEKMLKEFIPSSTPGFQQEVFRIQRVFFKTNFKLESLYQGILQSNILVDSQNDFTITRSPLELAMGLLKSFHIKINSQDRLKKINSYLIDADQNLFNQGDVKGWNTGEDWINMSSLTYRIALAKFIFDDVLQNKCIENTISFKKNLNQYLLSQKIHSNKIFKSCNDLYKVRDLIISNNQIQMR